MSIVELLWNKNVWGFLIIIVFIVFAIVSIIFAYHWRRYGEDLKIIKMGSFVYIIGAVALLALIVLTFQTL